MVQFRYCLNFKINGGITQLVEYWFVTPKAVGSSPISSAFAYCNKSNMKQNLYFYLIKLGVHIGHSKIDWNPNLNSLMAGMTKSNYLIFNINKSIFFFKRTLLFYKLLGYNNGSFIIYYMGNLSNYTDALEGYLDKEGIVPSSYPFLYSIVKPGFFSNWKTNYKYLIKSFYKVIFYNQYFFISLINKVSNDYFNNNKLTYKRIQFFGRKLKKISDFHITKKIHKMYFPFFHKKKIIKLIKGSRNSSYLKKLKAQIKKNPSNLKKFIVSNFSLNNFKTTKLYNYKQITNLINISDKVNPKNIRILNSFLLKQLFLYHIKFQLFIKQKKKKKKGIKLNIKKQYTDLIKMISYLNSKIKYLSQLKQNIKYTFNRNINNYLSLKKKKKKKEISNELLSQSFKMFYYNIYSLFLNVFFRRVRFKSNNLSLTPNEYKFFLRFLKFILIFRYLKRIKKIPNSILLLNPESNESQFTDFNFLKIALAGVVDSNSNLANLSYFIPSNDDSIIILLFYIKLILFSFENGKKNFFLKNLVNQLDTSKYIYNKKKILYNSESSYNKSKYDPFDTIEKKYKLMDKYLKNLKSKYYAGELTTKKKNFKVKNKLKLNLNKIKYQSLLLKLQKSNEQLFNFISENSNNLMHISLYRKKKKKSPFITKAVSSESMRRRSFGKKGVQSNKNQYNKIQNSNLKQSNSNVNILLKSFTKKTTNKK